MNHSRVPGFRYRAPAVTPVAPAAAKEAEEGIQCFVAVGQPRQDGHGHHAAGQPGVAQTGDQLQPALGPGVPGSTASDSASSVMAREMPMPTGTWAAARFSSGMSLASSVPLVRMDSGVPESASARDDAGHQLVAALGALVGIGVGAQGHLVAAPGRLGQFLPEDFRGIDLDHHLAVEVQAGVEIQVGVALAGKAVDAGVAAAAVGVDGPLERHP